MSEEPTIEGAWLARVVARALSRTLDLPVSRLPAYETHIFSLAVRSQVDSLGLCPGLADVLQAASQLHEDLEAVGPNRHDWPRTVARLRADLAKLHPPVRELDASDAYALLRRIWLDSDGTSTCPAEVREEVLFPALNRVAMCLAKPAKAPPADLPTSQPHRDAPTPELDRAVAAVILSADPSAIRVCHPWHVRDLEFLGLHPDLVSACRLLHQSRRTPGGEQLEPRAIALARKHRAEGAGDSDTVWRHLADPIEITSDKVHLLEGEGRALAIRTATTLPLLALAVECHALDIDDSTPARAHAKRMGLQLTYDRESRWLGSVCDEVIALLERAATAPADSSDRRTASEDMLAMPSPGQVAVTVDLETNDQDATDQWSLRLPGLVTAARSRIAAAPGHRGTLRLLQPVALRGNPARGLRLDFSTVGDRAQREITFPVHPDGRLGEAVLDA